MFSGDIPLKRGINSLAKFVVERRNCKPIIFILAINFQRKPMI
jgi:hypothetical protein